MIVAENQQESVGRFKEVSKKKASGSTYTPFEFASFVAKQILAQANHLDPKNSVKIFDPAAGDGELLLALITELKSKGFKKIEVFGFDTDPEAVLSARSRITDGHPELKVTIEAQDFLETLAEVSDGTLNFFDEQKANKTPKFDLVIANPPYVRTQILGAKSATALANKFQLQGRVDLYYAFLLGIDAVLSPQAIVGFIVSNRFMTTKAGGSVRKGLSDKFQMLNIWDFGDTRLFNAAVLPAVLVMKPKEVKTKQIEKIPFVSMYSSSNGNVDVKAGSIFECMHTQGIVEIPKGKFEIRIGELSVNCGTSDVWRLENTKSSNFLEMVSQNTFCTFRDIGKIRVGIKTTADNVFIRSDWHTMPEDERPELLKPLITHHVAKRYKTEADKNTSVLYPHSSKDGVKFTVDISEFPNSGKYLNQHKTQLTSRKYVIEAGRKWYEIWVPHKPNFWTKPKIVFRDISEKPTFWLDTTGAIVNGDCYWLCSENSENEEMLWLVLAISNSTFIESFYDQKFNNKLYAGRRRFMTQYVEQFPLPDPKSKVGKSLISKVKEIYESLPMKDTAKLEHEVDKLVWQSFGLDFEKING